jgi:hypothetical protein
MTLLVFSVGFLLFTSVLYMWIINNNIPAFNLSKKYLRVLIGVWICFCGYTIVNISEVYFPGYEQIDHRIFIFCWYFLLPLFGFLVVYKRSSKFASFVDSTIVNWIGR